MIPERLLTNYYEVVAMILFGIGFTTLLLNRNLVKKVIGINIASNAIFLFWVAQGYIAGRAAPIIVDSVQDVNAYINPIPSGLMLTGIVISVSVTAFSLALIVRLYRRYCTLDMDEIVALSRAEEDAAEKSLERNRTH